MSVYPSLNRAQLSYDYLHTNSTTHEFLFGALVELVDNSRDAGAERCDVFTVPRNDLRGGRMLCFVDNGCGMFPNEARNVMTFGYSAKRKDPSMIGQYGNGLKSGAMRVGKDMILFTKKENQLTCLLLSRTFHEEENIDEVIIPAPSFDHGKNPLTMDGDSAKHDMEMEIILKHSPFHSTEDLLKQFDLIKDDHGTLIIIYNLKLLENGEPELDFVSEPADIRLSDPEGSDSSDAKFHFERISLRSYLAVIYANPRMKIYIQGKKIRTRRIVNCLYKVRCYKYSSAKFKARAEKQIQESKDQLIAVQERVKEAESKLADFERKFGANPAKKDLRTEWRQMQDKVTLSKQDVKRLKDITEEKIKQLKEPKILTFMFGMNLERRTHDGCFIYNNGRLIRMYEKMNPQMEGTKKCCGVVGVVDIPFVVLEPTHNKQDFADSREYRQLLRAMGEHMDQYWRDLNLAAQPGGLVQFWQQFGYISNDWNLAPSEEERFIKKRLMSVNLTLQCDICLKWRILPYESKQAKGEFADTWSCSQNPDTTCSKCPAAEKMPNFPVGRLEKLAVTVDQKRELLQKKIEKQQNELKQIAKLSNVTSRKGISAAQSRAKELATRQAAAKHSASAKKKSDDAKSRRRKSPSPPPAKKPRTKADLRKQMEAENESESEEDEEEEGEEEETATNRRSPRAASKETPANSKTPPSTTSRMTPSTVAPPQIGKRLSSSRTMPTTVAAVNGDASAHEKQKDASSITVSVDKNQSPEKKLSVERLEAHSTNQTGDDATLASMVVTSSSNGQTSATPSASANNTALPPAQSAQQVDELASRLRRFLYYFLPPNWTKLTKQQVGQLTPDELIHKVDLPEFFQAYECGLKKLVADHQKSADSAQQQLRNLRVSASKVLKNLSPNVEISPGCENESVDKTFEHLAEKCTKE